MHAFDVNVRVLKSPLYSVLVTSTGSTLYLGHKFPNTESKKSKVTSLLSKCKVIYNVNINIKYPIKMELRRESIFSTLTGYFKCAICI